MSLLADLHERRACTRRIDALAELLATLGLEAVTGRERVRPYPGPLDRAFGGGLQLFADLAVPARSATRPNGA